MLKNIWIGIIKRAPHFLSKLLLYAITVILGLFAQTTHAIDSASLNQLIAEKKITTIEQLLNNLPYSFLSRYTLVFHSRSLQGASFDNPRVILFGQNGKFIMSFNGNPNQAGYNAIEVMDFDEQRNQFIFREYIFTDKKTVSVSETNPDKCLKCHGTTARPVWDNHPAWPGVFGERYHVPLGKQEQQGLNNFIINQSQHPRYRYLKNVKMLMDHDTFAPSTQVNYNGSEKDPPNVALSHMLSVLNGRALVQELTESPSFDQFKYALLGSVLSDCGPVSDFLPQPMRAQFMRDFGQFSSLTQQINQEQQQRKRLRTLTPDQGAVGFAPDDTATLTPLRYLAEKGLGIKTDGWTMALEKKTYDFTAPQPLARNIGLQLFDIIAQTDAAIGDFSTQRYSGINQKYCKYLREKSWSSLKEYLSTSPDVSVTDEKTSLKQVISEPDSLKLCIACHQGKIGPNIPFDDAEKLADALKTGHYRRGTLLEEILFRLKPESGLESMPRNINLPTTDRLALQDYFNRLANRTSP